MLWNRLLKKRLFVSGHGYNKVSLLESAEANTGEYAKAIRAEKTDFGHNVAPTQDKIIANEKAINKEKSANLKRYEEKGGKSQ